MPTTTTNYSLYKPLVNDATDEDLWGGYLNDNFDDLDTIIKDIADDVAAIQGVDIGDIKASIRQTPPTKWYVCAGGTVGSASSGGTLIAAAGASTLFGYLWDNFSNTVLAIQDSSGVATTRGASAAADFAANKRMPVPDLRDRTIFGWGSMGGSSANRLTGLITGGIDGDVFGATGGEEAHALTSAENGPHTHAQTVTESGAGSSQKAPLKEALDSPTNEAAVATGSSGSGTPHNTVPPGMVLNYIIYAGV